MVKLRKGAPKQAALDEKILYQFEKNYEDRDPLSQEGAIVWTLLAYPWPGGLLAQEFCGEELEFPQDGRAIVPALKRLERKGIIKKLAYGYWDFCDARIAVAWLKELWPRWCEDWTKLEAQAKQEELEKLKRPNEFGLETRSA